VSGHFLISAVNNVNMSERIAIRIAMLSELRVPLRKSTRPPGFELVFR
jgi:hypothetical protein